MLKIETITAEEFDLFENAMVWVQYPRRNAASSRLNHCNCSSQYRDSLVKETIIIITIRKGRFVRLATCRCDTSAVLSSNAKSVITVENTRE